MGREIGRGGGNLGPSFILFIVLHHHPTIGAIGLPLQTKLPYRKSVPETENLLSTSDISESNVIWSRKPQGSKVMSKNKQRVLVAVYYRDELSLGENRQ